MFNILYVENFSEIIGGGQRSLLDLLRVVDKTKFNPIVVVPAEGSLSSRLKEMNITVRLIGFKSLRRLNIIDFGKFYKRIKIITPPFVPIGTKRIYCYVI